MSREIDRALRLSLSILDFALAAAVLVLGILSISGGTYRYLPAMAVCAAVYNLAQAAETFLGNRRKPYGLITLEIALALLCVFFAFVTYKGL